MTKSKFLVILPLIILPIFMPLQAHAFYLFGNFLSQQDYSDIRLNETMPNPDGSDTDYEWVEIYNSGNSAINLESCEIDNKVFNEDISIEGRGYLVIAKDLLDDDQDGQSFEERWGDGNGVWGDSEDENYQAVDMAISMKNSDDSIDLVCGEYVDIASWELADSGKSFSLGVDDIWHEDYIVTPGNENVEIPEVIYTHSIQMTEIYPSPDSTDGENEWIEIYNYGEDSVDLQSWVIEDSSRTMVIKNSFLVKGGEYEVIENENLSLTLNNTGETITLLDPNEELVDIFEFGDTEKKISNIRVYKNGKYLSEIVQTQAITKGKRNEYIDPEDLFYEKDILGIREARKMGAGNTVCIEGVVSVEISKLSQKMLYIQDDKSGIAVYFSEEEIGSNLNVGDEIRIVGEIRESYGELRISISDRKAIMINSKKGKVIPLTEKTGSVTSAIEGKLTFISGEIVETSGKTFYINDGSGKAKVVIKTSTGIETPNKKKGQYAGVLGIVNRAQDGSYRLLPRYSNDIVISDAPIEYNEFLAVTGQKIHFYLILALLILFFSGITTYIYLSRKAS